MTMTTERLEELLDRARQRRRLPDPKTRRLLRERAGITQAALAEAVGVSRAALCRWELGDREPDEQFLAKYLAALDRLAREAVS
ncbi:MAG TPA: helix-turn-helix transcriptional regulator [bacterium]|nr:helix-turn-helix transcriptional regulator [bacterium]